MKRTFKVIRAIEKLIYDANCESDLEDLFDMRFILAALAKAIGAKADIIINRQLGINGEEMERLQRDLQLLIEVAVRKADAKPDCVPTIEERAG